MPQKKMKLKFKYKNAKLEKLDRACGNWAFYDKKIYQISKMQF